MILQATIKWSNIAPAILYPREGNDSIINTWQAGQPFLIIMVAPNWCEIIQRWGHCIVRLDGLYKATRHGLPLYTLVVSDDDGHTWPIATALLLSNMSEMVAKFLDVVRMNLGDDEWAPMVMINKDAHKCAVINSVSLSFALCDFHVQQAWRRASTWFCRKGTTKKFQ